MRRRRLTVALLAAALVVGACGKAPEDKAHDDGKRVGQAVRTLFDSRSISDAQAAVADLKGAVKDVGGEVKQSVQTQLDTQRDTLERAVQGARQGNVQAAKDQVQQVRAQAEAFRHSNSSVANEFWRGFEEGYDG
jgi:small-conductance mechanosensitive channel